MLLPTAIHSIQQYIIVYHTYMYTRIVFRPQRPHPLVPDQPVHSKARLQPRSPRYPIFPLQVRLHQHRCSHRGGRAAARHAALDDSDDGGTVCVKRGMPRTGLGSFARGAAALQSALRQWLQGAPWQLPRPGSTAGCPVRSRLPPQHSHHRLGSDCRKRCHSDDKHMACPQFWRTLQSSIAFYIERRASSAKSISFIKAFDSFRLACDPLCSLQALDVFIEVPLQRWPASVHMIWLHDGQSWTQSEVMLEIYIFGETAFSATLDVHYYVSVLVAFGK